MSLTKKLLCVVSLFWLLVFLSCNGSRSDFSGLNLSVESYRNHQFEEYSLLEARLQDGIVIPGLAENFVPQGLALVPQTGDLLISGYLGLSFSEELNASGKVVVKVEEELAVLLLLEVSDLSVKKIAILEDEAGEVMYLHAGGVAVAGSSIWIPAKNRLYRFSLQELLESEDFVLGLNLEAIRRVDSKGSFVSASDGFLFVGEFLNSPDDVPSYHHSPHNTKHWAWTALYPIDEVTGYFLVENSDRSSLIPPSAVVHHRQYVQGFTISETGWVVLSASYGNRDSKIAFYDVGLEFKDLESWPDKTKLPSGVEIPSLTLSRDNWKFTLMAPPGSEEVVFSEDGLLAVAFEGGAYPYRERWDVIEDRVLFLRIPEVAE
jgi:hypothetical protein